MSALDVETVILALNLCGCQATKAGRSAWRSGCPSCLQPGVLGVSWGFGGLLIVARCGCSRAEILAELGLEEPVR